MQVPSGGPAPEKRPRPVFPEDDATFAPPPMSAYSIAVFSSNAARGPPAEHIPAGGPCPWRPRENAALKRSLREKLSAHFLTGSQQPAAAGRGHPLSPQGTAHSASNSPASGGGGPRVPECDASKGVALYTPSHSDSTGHSGSATHSGGSHKNAGNELLASLSHDHLALLSPSPAPDTPAANTPRASEQLRPAPVSAPKKRSCSPHADAPSAPLPLASHGVGGPAVGARPWSNGPLVRRSRLSRRFKALGPPKRASEMGLADPPVPDNSGSPAGAAGPRTLKSPLPQLSPEAASGVCVRKPVSADSDFFKSLRRLKDASPVPELRGQRISSGIARSPGTENPHFSQTPRLPPAPPSFRRQPLQEVPPGVLNADRSSGGFKKPKIPKPPGAGPIPGPASLLSVVPQDLTPRMPSSSLVKHSDPVRPSAPRVDADRGKKVIQLNAREYEKLEVLGRGGTSKVYKVRSLSDRRAYALKKVSFDQFDESCVRGFKGEIDLLTRLKHETRVVSLIDHAVSEGSLYLLMECGDLDLAHALQKKMNSEPTLDPNFVRFHALEIFRCIQAVHNAGIVHSDLKPANFLFVDGILKIIDFGIANAVPDHTVNIYRHSQIGTPNYMAPEALVEDNNVPAYRAPSATTTWRVGRPSDIWSCGCIIYQMIYGRPPYASYSGQQRIMAIMNPQVEVLYAAAGLGGVRVPVSAITLMKKCLERNPGDRWTVDECLNSDFLRPKAVDQDFVKALLRDAVSFGQQNPHAGSIDEGMYNELVDNILGKIKDLNLA